MKERRCETCRWWVSASPTAGLHGWCALGLVRELAPECEYGDATITVVKRGCHEWAAKED